MEGVMRVVGDQCRCGLKSEDHRGEGPAKKPTGIMTNSPCIALQLKSRCPPTKNGYQVHRNAQVQGGRARAAQTYPPELCRAICKGLVKQFEADKKRNYLIVSIEYDHQSTS